MPLRALEGDHRLLALDALEGDRRLLAVRPTATAAFLHRSRGMARAQLSNTGILWFRTVLRYHAKMKMSFIYHLEPKSMQVQVKSVTVLPTCLGISQAHDN